MIKLSVVVPTHQRPKSLLRLLESISRQGLAKDQFEVLVVSNFEDPKLRQAMEKPGHSLRNARLLVAGTRGANASRNLGIQESRGEIILLLDDDCFLEIQGFLQAVIDQHRDQPGALAIGGSYSIPEWCRPEDIAYNIIARDWQLSGTAPGGVSLRLLGGNVSYKKALLAATGELFNPGISYGGAELEFHSRLAKKGAILLLVPELSVHHLPEIKNAGELVKKAYKQAMTTVQFSIQDTHASITRAYHSRRNAMALQHAADEFELARICEIMVGYDRAYNLVSRGGVVTLPKLKFRLAAEKLWASLGWAE